MLSKEDRSHKDKAVGGQDKCRHNRTDQCDKAYVMMLMPIWMVFR